MTDFTHLAKFEVETCCNCGMQFGMPSAYQRQRRNDKQWFYCPSGHQQHDTGPTEAARLKDELERKQSMLDAERARAQTLAKQRDEVSRAHLRMRKRVMNSICPCCNRTFQNLLRHMQTEHAEQRTLRVLREAIGLTQKQLAEEIGTNQATVSKHERGRPVSEYALQSINEWMARQDGVTPER